MGVEEHGGHLAVERREAFADMSVAPLQQVTAAMIVTEHLVIYDLRIYDLPIYVRFSLRLMYDLLFTMYDLIFTIYEFTMYDLCTIYFLIYTFSLTSNP